MNLTEQLTDYVHAAFTGLRVQTQEPDEAEREITQLARSRGWKLAAWDVAAGLRVPSERGAFRGDALPGDRWPCCGPCPPWPTATAPP